MFKSKKKIAFAIIAIAVIFAIVGLFLRLKEEIDTHINISSTQIDDNGNVHVSDYTSYSPDTLANFTNEFNNYCSGYYKEFLSEKEKIVYNAYVYAAYNGYSYIQFPVAGYSEIDLNKVYDFVKGDNPFVEHNMESRGDDIEHSLALLKSLKIKYKTVYLQSSNEQALSKKIEALECAKDIVKDMPEFQSDIDKAWYLYNYVTSNVTYSEHENPNYIYDALVLGKSNCDGISKSIALLFNMVGIECFNVFYSDRQVIVYNLFLRSNIPPEIAFNSGKEFNSDYRGLQSLDEILDKLHETLKNQYDIDLKESTDWYGNGKWIIEGHAWNIAKLDGEYHYFDATWESVEMYPFYFAVSSKIHNMEVKSTIREYIPACTTLNTMDTVYLEVDDITEETSINIIAERLNFNITSQSKPYVNIIADKRFTREDVNNVHAKLEELTGFSLTYWYTSRILQMQYRIQD